MSFSARWIACLGLSLAVIASPAMAQDAVPSPGRETPQIAPGNTFLEIELLTPRTGGSLLASQRWRIAFEKTGEPVRIRSPLADERAEVTEKTRGTFRFVKLVGEIDSKERVHFPDRTFTLEEVGKLDSWLKELKVYGAQGSPEGQPLWGLSREQFDAVFKSLAAPVESFTDTGQLIADLRQLPLPAGYPLRMDDSVDDKSPTHEVGHVIDSAGLTTGTILAAVLSHYGLGYRPLRTPAGAIELVVQPLDDISDPWPIGWDVGREQAPGRVVPALFKIEPFIGLDPQSLETALKSIAATTMTPVVVDYHRCLLGKIDPAKIQVNYPYKRTAWGVVLISLLRKNLLDYTLRNDEMGQVFLYVHPFERTLIRPE